MSTIAGQPITRGEIRIFEQGDWFADISTNTDELLPVGSRVEIISETLVLSGAIVRGGITDAVGRYQVAGRPEWGTELVSRPSAAYRSAGAVLLRTVLDDIAREALGPNRKLLVVMPAIPPNGDGIGGHYERVGTADDVRVLARDALELLGVPWYVRADGITVFAERPTGDVSTSEQILVEYRNDAIGYRVVNCEDPGAFVPGLTFEGETIGEVVFSLLPEDIRIHVWTRAASNAFAEALRAVWRRIFPRVELQGFFSYTTVGPSQAGKHDLRSTRSRHLPDVTLADSWLAPGFSAELSAGTRVLVAFADGDPASPVLVAVEAGASPAVSALAATASIGIDAAAVNLGAATARVLRSGDTLQLIGALSLTGPNFVIAKSNVLDPPTVTPTRVKA